MEVHRVDLAIALDGPELLQLGHDLPPGLHLLRDIRFFLSLARSVSAQGREQQQ